MGAPLGNNNAGKAKRWTAAIERVLEKWPEQPSRENKSELIIGIESAAYDFVSELKGKKDLGYFKEFGDRLEGKPAQALNVGISPDEDNPIHQVVKSAAELLPKIRGR